MTATPPAGTTATSGSVAARLDRLPLSRWHRRMTLLIGIGSFFNFFEIALGSLLAVLLKDPWHLGGPSEFSESHVAREPGLRIRPSMGRQHPLLEGSAHARTRGPAWLSPRWTTRH